MIDFLKQLASASPTPGGGAVAAVNGAMGAALTVMAAGLTTGKEKYAEHEEKIEKTLAEARELQLLFTALTEEDIKAYGEVAGVFTMPKASPGEKAARKAAMQEALKKAVEPPMAVMRLSVQSLKLIHSAVDICNVNAISDLGVASLASRAALCGAWLNVKTNLKNIKDDEFIHKHTAEGMACLNEALPLADEVYRKVIECL